MYTVGHKIGATIFDYKSSITLFVSVESAVLHVT